MSETLSRFALPLGTAAAETAIALEIEQSNPIIASRALFDEQLRQQREIFKLQSEQYAKVIEGQKQQMQNVLGVMERLGVIDLAIDFDTI